MNLWQQMIMATKSNWILGEELNCINCFPRFQSRTLFEYNEEDLKPFHIYVKKHFNHAPSSNTIATRVLPKNIEMRNIDGEREKKKREKYPPKCIRAKKPARWLMVYGFMSKCERPNNSKPEKMVSVVFSLTHNR